MLYKNILSECKWYFGGKTYIFQKSSLIDGCVEWNLPMWQYTRWPTPLSQPAKPVMAIRSSSGFSHLRPGVFHISLQKHKIQHTQKRTNNYKLGWALSARGEKFVTLLHSFLCICGLLQVCIWAKFPHSYQECWLILSHQPTQPLVHKS